jgi:hypothetical protein
MSRTRGAPARKRPGTHARRPGPRVPGSIRRRIPSAARILATLAFAVLVGGLVTLVNGPWLRVDHVASAGARFTRGADLDALLAPYRGASLLTLDSDALRAELQDLPAVAEARVSARLPDQLEVSLTEKAPAFTWLTVTQRLVVAADGSIIAALSHDGDLPAELAPLPTVDDLRSASRTLAPGAAVPANELAMAARLLATDPAMLGSASTGFTLQIDAEYGFILVSRKPAWRVALGFYQLDPQETEATALARLDAQLAAVRTLFATQPEAKVTWVDARNPGKVYWAR